MSPLDLPPARQVADFAASAVHVNADELRGAVLGSYEVYAAVSSNAAPRDATGAERERARRRAVKARGEGSDEVRDLMEYQTTNKRAGQ